MAHSILHPYPRWLPAYAAVCWLILGTSCGSEDFALSASPNAHLAGEWCEVTILPIADSRPQVTEILDIRSSGCVVDDARVTAGSIRARVFREDPGVAGVALRIRTTEGEVEEGTILRFAEPVALDVECGSYPSFLTCPSEELGVFEGAVFRYAGVVYGRIPRDGAPAEGPVVIDAPVSATSTEALRQLGEDRSFEFTALTAGRTYVQLETQDLAARFGIRVGGPSEVSDVALHATPFARALVNESVGSPEEVRSRLTDELHRIVIGSPVRAVVVSTLGDGNRLVGGPVAIESDDPEVLGIQTYNPSDGWWEFDIEGHQVGVASVTATVDGVAFQLEVEVTPGS